MKLLKKIISLVVPVVAVLALADTVHASRQLGLDVSSYNRSDLAYFQTMKYYGARFTIVKLGGSGGGEGEHYQNPKASQQLAMAQKAGMDIGTYFWGEFGGSTAQAKKMARYAIADAKRVGLKAGSVIALDYELGASGSVSANTSAIVTFMKAIDKAGYKPLLYSGAYYLRTHVNRSNVLKHYQDSLWIASYATMQPVSGPNYNYFPSMDGIAIWQFGATWHGADGNVKLLKNALKKGQVKHNVKITKDTSKTSYTVKEGDSWHSIATKYGMDENQLAKLNGKTVKSMIHPGDKIKLAGTIDNDAKPTKATTSAINKVVKVKSLGAGKASWKVRLINGAGKYTNRYVAQCSRWKVSKVKQTSKGKACLIGKDLYILAKYVK